jgi:hypothetical protein
VQDKNRTNFKSRVGYFGFPKGAIYDGGVVAYDRSESMPAGDVRCTSRPGCSCAVCGAPFDLMDAAREYCTAFSVTQRLGSRDYDS